MRFEFATATRIIFGAGTLPQMGTIAAAMGKRALVVMPNIPGFAARLVDILDAQHIACQTFEVDREPTVELVLSGVRLVRETGCDVVISFGGGSVIDTGKAIAALTTNPGDPLDYLEVIGKGQALRELPLPFAAIPTTAGTGAEVTRNAVLASPEHKVKVSLRSAMMLAKVALVDPELTFGLPPGVTASTGLDALTQVLEPFVCNQPNPITDAICREGMQRAALSLRIAYHQGDNAGARTDMSLVSLFGGIALANAKLGAVHGFAGPIGGMFHAPHGAVCACLLPYVIATNVKALKARQPDNPVLARYEEVARLLTGSPTASVDDGVEWVSTLVQELAVPPLSSYGVSQADIPTLVENSARASSMQGNPIKLTNEELTEILMRAV